jgi:hypothetical protein
MIRLLLASRLPSRAHRGRGVAWRTGCAAAAGQMKVEVNAFGRVLRELPEDSNPATWRARMCQLDD